MPFISISRSDPVSSGVNEIRVRFTADVKQQTGRVTHIFVRNELGELDFIVGGEELLAYQTPDHRVKKITISGKYKNKWEVAIPPKLMNGLTFSKKGTVRYEYKWIAKERRIVIPTLFEFPDPIEPGKVVRKKLEQPEVVGPLSFVCHEFEWSNTKDEHLRGLGVEFSLPGLDVKSCNFTKDRGARPYLAAEFRYDELSETVTLVFKKLMAKQANHYRVRKLRGRYKVFINTNIYRPISRIVALFDDIEERQAPVKPKVEATQLGYPKLWYELTDEFVIFEREDKVRYYNNKPAELVEGTTGVKAICVEADSLVNMAPEKGPKAFAKKGESLASYVTHGRVHTEFLEKGNKMYIFVKDSLLRDFFNTR